MAIPWLQLGQAALGAFGSYQAQKKLGQAGDKMFSAGDDAWERGQYKPYGVSTGFGNTSYEDGEAKFNLDDRYQGQQDQLFGLGGAALSAAGGDYDQMAQDMYQRQRDIGAGGRQAEAQALGESMFGSGTRGLRVAGEALGAGTDTGKFSPQGYGFAQAFAQQDSADRANAFNQAQLQRERELNIGTNMLGAGQGIDQLGMGMLGLGGELGSMRSNANNTAMSNLLQGYGTGAGLMADRGRAQAGGFHGLGSSLGKMSSLPPVGNKMMSYTPIGSQNTWKDYTDNNGYGVG